jgi:TetR/AcrR family tetracycline transcriptional repressor
MALERKDVVNAARAISDADGLDQLTLRAIARNLGVQAPTLYWHVRNKAELLEALADAIIAEALDALDTLDPTGGWQEWLCDAAVALRRALLDHRDGARIIAGATGSLTRADFSERIIGHLVAEGVGLQHARLLVIGIERFTLGFVLEEQSIPDDRDPPDLEELKRRLPLSTQAIIDYFAAGRTADDLFIDGIRLIID